MKFLKHFLGYKKICHITTDVLDYNLGEFITENLAYILANTTHDQWQLLKIEIEDTSLDEYIRSACLEALALFAAKNPSKRPEIVQYFKSLFHRILNEELCSNSFPTHLIDSCSQIWPGECLEEIRELSGLGLIDESFIDFAEVLALFTMGKDACVEESRKNMEARGFLKGTLPTTQPIQTPSQTYTSSKPDRNDPCICGSGRKYKKCCLLASNAHSPNRHTEEAIISYEPLETPLDPMKALPKEEQESIVALHDFILEEPEKALGPLKIYVSKYQNIPQIYNLLYITYQTLKQPFLARKVLIDTLERFPDYFFAKIEQARYFLRRAEPEKAHAVLNNAYTLTQMYPDRKVFHISEFQSFTHAMSFFFIEKNDIKQAEFYLQLLEKIAHDSFEIQDIKRRIRSKHFLDTYKKP